MARFLLFSPLKMCSPPGDGAHLPRQLRLQAFSLVICRAQIHTLTPLRSLAIKKRKKRGGRPSRGHRSCRNLASPAPGRELQLICALIYLLVLNCLSNEHRYIHLVEVLWAEVRCWYVCVGGHMTISRTWQLLSIYLHPSRETHSTCNHGLLLRPSDVLGGTKVIIKNSLLCDSDWSMLSKVPLICALIPSYFFILAVYL